MAADYPTSDTGIGQPPSRTIARTDRRCARCDRACRYRRNAPPRGITAPLCHPHGARKGGGGSGRCRASFWRATPWSQPGGAFCPRPKTRQPRALACNLLSGRRHRVWSAIALRAPDGTVREKLSETAVKFKRLTDDELEAYIDGGEWRGKAGGYAIQGSAEGLISWIQGSHSGVVGLPLYETRILLQSSGFAVG